MAVADVAPCIRVTLKNGICGCDLYICEGDRVIFTCEGYVNPIEAIFAHIELSQYPEYEADVLYFLDDNDKQYVIPVDELISIDEKR